MGVFSSSSVKRYEKNTVDAKKDWKQSSLDSADKYARVMARFGASFRKAKEGYVKGIKRTSPEKFAVAVRHKGEKWKRKLKEAVC